MSVMPQMTRRIRRLDLQISLVYGVLSGKSTTTMLFFIYNDLLVSLFIKVHKEHLYIKNIQEHELEWRL